MRPRDSQIVEMWGRHWLINQLLRADLEVAIPQRDRGIDLIAYADLSATGRFVARPIQMKASVERSFDVRRRYERFHDLLLVYVWHLEEPQLTTAYALTFKESERIAAELGWTKTPSWLKGGASAAPGYGTRRPSRRLLSLLETHRMTSADRWYAKVLGSPD